MTVPLRKGRRCPTNRQHISQEPTYQDGHGPNVIAESDQARSSRVEPEQSVVSRAVHVQEYPVRRTFSEANSDVWNEFLQYFENLAELNSWRPEKSRRVLLSTLRGQAETFAYGTPLMIQRDYDRLKRKMGDRFGHTAMKEKYIAEAKLRKRQPGESLRDFGQALEDLYRRAYPDNPDIVEENAIKAFLDKCGQSDDFRLAVKRTRPRTLQGAVINAMQEECLRVGEKELAKDKPVNRNVYEEAGRGNRMEMINNAGESPREDVASRGNRGYGYGAHHRSYPPEQNRGYRSRPYNRQFGRGGRTDFARIRDRTETSNPNVEPTGDSGMKPLN